VIRRVVLVVALAVVPLALGGCSAATVPSHSQADSKYGSLPDFLPKSTLDSDSTLAGSIARPALTTQGDTVRVEYGNGTVLATVGGPLVPGEGLPFQAEATTCTWTVTVRGATTSVPIRAEDFTSIDHLGAIYRPTLHGDRGALPSSIGPGETVMFELRAVMNTGEGLMRWSPGGHGVEASWDFEVEND
jgi:hypothetical protein